MSYDRADWHSGGELHRTEVPEALDAVRTRKMTGRDFLLQYCDEKFTDEDLNDEGNAFAAEYYATEGDSGR